MDREARDDAEHPTVPANMQPLTPATESYPAQNVNVYDNEKLEHKTKAADSYYQLCSMTDPLPPSLSLSVYIRILILFLSTSTVYIRFDNW